MSTRNVHYFLLTLILALLLLVGWLGWTLYELSPASTEQIISSQTSDPPFTLKPSPVLRDITQDDPPLYLFAFTHTEDHINHELSEERYWRMSEILERITADFPELPFTWTIEFQGADAKSITDRDPETGLVQELLALQKQGFIEFGYHAHHEPTYMNRPQKDLSNDPTFEEVYEALDTWVTCEKDPLFGGCISETGGGLKAIEYTFGEVVMVSGLGYDDGFLIERSAGSQVLRNHLPNRLLGFGLPDHGAALNDEDYSRARDELLKILTPTNETSSGTYWQDNAIRINDGIPLDGIGSIRMQDGAKSARLELARISDDRPHVLNVDLADKYIYTKSGTSPTKWAYANTDSPELPEEWLNSRREIEQSYSDTEDGLHYLMEYMSEQTNGSQFVNTNEVIDLFTSEDYWNVHEDELEQMALWIVHQWEDAPPSWVYDGEDFYSLADAWMLLKDGLNNMYLEEGPISTTYAPWSGLEQITPSKTVVAAEEVLSFAEDVSVMQDRLDVAYQIGDHYLSLTQSLYAMAYAYLMKVQGTSGEITIPPVTEFPETYYLLEDLGYNGCFDTTWSLKPARFQD